MSRKSSSVSFGAKPSEPSVCVNPRELLADQHGNECHDCLETVTYDLAASFATMSDNEIDSALGLGRPLMLSCLGLLLPSCEEGDGVGTKLKGLLLSNLGIGIVSNWGVWASCGTGGREGDIIELGAGSMGSGVGSGFGRSDCCGMVRAERGAAEVDAAASGVILRFSPDASSPKKVLKTPLCCHAWMKNSCWDGSRMALTSLLPSGCLR